jgi:hypothetical protein
MEITRDVIYDLLPLYLACEACPDTRALVEAYLAQNPELALEVKKEKAEDLLKIKSLQGEEMQLPADHEARTLNRTKALLERRKWIFGLAIFFTLAPLSFIFEGGRITWMMLRDAPRSGLIYWLAASGLWVAWMLADRKLRNSGL